MKIILLFFDNDSILVWLFLLICKGTILTTGAGGPYYITVGGHSSAEVAKSQKHVINEVVSDFISQENVVWYVNLLTGLYFMHTYIILCTTSVLA